MMMKFITKEIGRVFFIFQTFSSRICSWVQLVSCRLYEAAHTLHWKQKWDFCNKISTKAIPLEFELTETPLKLQPHWIEATITRAPSVSGRSNKQSFRIILKWTIGNEFDLLINSCTVLVKLSFDAVCILPVLIFFYLGWIWRGFYCG